MIKEVGHIGIAVEDIEAFTKSICKVLNVSIPEIKDNKEKKMKFAIINNFNVGFEIIEDYGENGTIKQYTEKHGNAIHHFCLLTDDIEDEVENLSKKGIEMADLIPKMGLRGKKIAFSSEKLLGGIPFELSEP
jgi:methylmalonyl-CoA/ethylmalonyl-CoA epimerase